MWQDGWKTCPATVLFVVKNTTFIWKNSLLVEKDFLEAGNALSAGEKSLYLHVLHINFYTTDEKFSKTDSDNSVVSHLRDISVGSDLRQSERSRYLCR